MKPFRTYLPIIAAAGMAVAAAVLPAYGAPARPGILLCPQPDGSAVECVLRGDEHCHWYETPGGDLLEADADGYLRPAAGDYRQALARKRSAAADRQPARAPLTTFPTTGTQRALVVLVEFQDTHFTYGLENFGAMITQRGYAAYGAAGSAADYYRENSAGRFDPQFDVVGPVRLSHPVAYYGGSDDANAHEMMVEACRALDAEVDFSRYDRDGDGWVDNVYIFYAGHGEADGGGVNTVWPHSANIFSKGERLTLDGVQLGQYACSNELLGGGNSMVGIGTFCHEFGHVLGLPDLYATNGEEVDTPYYWSLMDHGNYNSNGRCPCALTAFERMSLGWLEPWDLPADYAGPLCLPPVEENVAYRVSTPGSDNEYYLIEHRAKSGWDAALPASGLLIWHIDYDKTAWDANRVNNDPARQRVDLVEAGGNSASRAAAAHPFPGASGVTSFAGFAPRLSTPLALSLTDIREDGGYVTLCVNGGQGTLPATPSAPVSVSPDDTFCDITLPTVGGDLLVSLKCNAGGRVAPAGEYTLAPCPQGTLRLSGLVPSTPYSLTLRQRNGTALGRASEPVAFTTLEPGFSFQAPVLLEPTDIKATGFTANWEAMPGADVYLFTLTTMADVAAGAVTEPFSNPLQLTPGWESNVSTTMGVSGYYGQEAPSLRISNNADYIETPLFDSDVTSLACWVRGYKLQGDARLTVSGYAPASGVWTDLGTIDGISNTAGEARNIDITADGVNGTGVRKVRLMLDGATSGSLCLDDVTVGFGTEQREQVLIDAEDCGDMTSKTITGLEKGRKYSYYVEALGSGRKSQPSARGEVVTNGPSGVGNILTDGQDAEILRIDGTRAADTSAPGLYIVRRGTHVTKILK